MKKKSKKVQKAEAEFDSARIKRAKAILEDWMLKEHIKAYGKKPKNQVWEYTIETWSSFNTQVGLRVAEVSFSSSPKSGEYIGSFGGTFMQFDTDVAALVCYLTERLLLEMAFPPRELDSDPEVSNDIEFLQGWLRKVAFKK